MMNSITIIDETDPEGVLFCLKDVGSTVLTDDSYSLSPYFLVYVGFDGEVKFTFSQMKKSLYIAKKYRSTAKEEGIKKQIDLSSLLEVAVNSVLGKSEEKGVESLFSRGGTVVSKHDYRGMDAFEVVSWQVFIRGNS